MTWVEVWRSFWSWITGTPRDHVPMGHEGDEDEPLTQLDPWTGKEEPVRWPEAAAFRNRRRPGIQKLLEDERRAGKKRSKVDPYASKHGKPEIRVLLAGGPFLKRVDIAGYSADTFPEGERADRQLAGYIRADAKDMKKRLDLYNKAVEIRRAAREERRRLRAEERARAAGEASFEQAVAIEQAEKERKKP